MIGTFWALWIISGGLVNSGSLAQPQVSAYFKTLEECLKVRTHVQALAPSRTMQCIQAEYIIGR